MALNNTLNEIAQEALKLIDDEFDNSVDPFWNPWVPLKRPTHKTLIDTGRLRSSFRIISVEETKFSIVNDTDYAKYHQNGTSRIPQRILLPEGMIPAKWQDKFVQVIEKDLKDELEKK